jgi:hypothetical protein
MTCRRDRYGGLGCGRSRTICPRGRSGVPDGPRLMTCRPGRLGGRGLLLGRFRLVRSRLDRFRLGGLRWGRSTVKLCRESRLRGRKGRLCRGGSVRLSRGRRPVGGAWVRGTAVAVGPAGRARWGPPRSEPLRWAPWVRLVLPRSAARRWVPLPSVLRRGWALVRPVAAPGPPRWASAPRARPRPVRAGRARHPGLPRWAPPAPPRLAPRHCERQPGPHRWAPLPWALPPWAVRRWGLRRWAPLPWEPRRWAPPRSGPPPSALRRWGPRRWALRRWGPRRWALRRWVPPLWELPRWALRLWVLPPWERKAEGRAPRAPVLRAYPKGVMLRLSAPRPARRRKPQRARRRTRRGFAGPGTSFATSCGASAASGS